MTIVTVVEMPEFQRRARAIMSDGEHMELIDFVARNPVSGVSHRRRCAKIPLCACR